MTTDLTGNKIKDTYQQILHVDGGVTSTDKTVYDGDGTATALKVSTTSVDVSSLKLSGSAITVTATQINAGVNAQPAAEAAALAAASSATASLNSANAAATTYDQFDDRYLGSKSSAPTVDNDGNALLTGALYFNTTTNVMNVWTGSAWSATYIPVTGYAPLNDPNFIGQITENALPIVSQADIGTAPNEIPLNQFLGSMAYLEAYNVSFTATGTNAVEQNLSVNKLTTVVISADTTLTTTVPKVCASAYVIVITSGTTSRTVTFGTGFKTTGTLATGTSADRRFVFHFISDGTNLVEVSRTASITY